MASSQIKLEATDKIESQTMQNFEASVNATPAINLRSTKSCLPTFSAAKSPISAITPQAKWKPRQLKETAEHLRQQNREQNKLKRFELELKRLKGMQSDFMQTCEGLKNTVNASLIPMKYKFLAVELNDKFQMLVNEEDLLRFPRNLPKQTVKDLKKSVHNCIEATIIELIRHLRSFIQTNKDKTSPSYLLDFLEERYMKSLAAKLNVCMEEIDQLCKHRTDDDLVKVSRELRESRRSCQKLQRQLNEVKKCNAEKSCSQICQHQTSLEKAIKAKGKSQSLLKKQIEELEKQLASQAVALDEKEKIIKSKNADIKILHNVILELNSK